MLVFRRKSHPVEHVLVGGSVELEIFVFAVFLPGDLAFGELFEILFNLPDHAGLDVLLLFLF